MLRVPDSLLGEAQGLGRQIHVLTEMAFELPRAREGACNQMGRSRPPLTNSPLTP